MSSEMSSRRWQTYRATLIATLPPICSLCGEPIDMGLSGNHRDGPTIDHRIPRSRGGQVYDQGNVALAHKRCNSSKRNDLTEQPHSRTW